MTAWAAMTNVAMVAAGGAVGAVARYGIGTLMVRVAGDRWPWGTLAANALGCFLFGMFMEVAQERAVFNETTRLLIFTGFLGALTTFSTYAHDATHMAGHQSLAQSAGYLLVQNVIGIGLLVAGTYLAKAVIG